MDETQIPDDTPAKKPLVTTAKSVAATKASGDLSRKAAEVPDLLDGVAQKLSDLNLENSDAKNVQAWWLEYRNAIAAMSLGQLLGILQSRFVGTTEAELLVLYRGLSPAELHAVLTASARTLSQITSERGREAALLRLAGTKLSPAAAQMLINALTVLI